jgi:tRNA A-37 threonylcarbamoyl transferase component Bud32
MMVGGGPPTLIQGPRPKTVDINQLELGKALGSGGSRPRSINEFTQTVGAPTPAFHKAITPAGTEGEVRSSRSKLLIAGGAVLGAGVVAAAIAQYGKDYKDMAYASPHGSHMRAHRPKVLESFTKGGAAGASRKFNTGGDFGTGWDPARRLAKALFGKAVKEGADEVARGAAFKEILRSDEFQEALAAGTPVREIGAGGIGSVELMETMVGGQKFRYARKQYLPKKLSDTDTTVAALRRGERNRDAEVRGLRAMRSKIAPTPYGKGTVAVEGRDIPVMYSEVIEGAEEAATAFARQGGVTRAQRTALEGAVRELHSRGLYHSDIRPANMLVDREGRLVLIDPMPERYGSYGKKLSKAVGQAQDQLALERIVTGGDPTSLRSDTNILANAVQITAGIGPKHPHFDKAAAYAQQIFRRAGAVDVAEAYGIPMVRSSGTSPNPSLASAKAAVSEQLNRTAAGKPIAKAARAAEEREAKRSLSRTIGATPKAVGTRGAVRSARKNIVSATAMSPTIPDWTVGEMATATLLGEGRASRAARVASMETLHTTAVKTAWQNNQRPAVRHRRMSQTQTAMDLGIHEEETYLF